VCVRRWGNRTAPHWYRVPHASSVGRVFKKGIRLAEPRCREDCA
jgi:hypothetical protein